LNKPAFSQDIDGADEHAMHLLATWRATGGVRLPLSGGHCLPRPASTSVIIRISARASGMAMCWMRSSALFKTMDRRWGTPPIRTGAQARLESSTTSIGFIKASPVYDEDGLTTRKNGPTRLNLNKPYKTPETK
jgi:predicted GNAT family N-acyltransferase